MEYTPPRQILILILISCLISEHFSSISVLIIHFLRQRLYGALNLCAQTFPAALSLVSGPYRDKKGTFQTSAPSRRVLKLARSSTSLFYGRSIAFLMICASVRLPHTYRLSQSAWDRIRTPLPAAMQQGCCCTSSVFFQICWTCSAGTGCFLRPHAV